jgi:hypothetical protein
LLKNELPLGIITDTREPVERNTLNKKGEYLFAGFNCKITRKCLSYGDYSLESYENAIAIDRKTLPDLFGSITGCRERFERVVAGLSQMEAGYVIVEASFADICKGATYRKAGKKITTSEAIINSVKGTITGWMLRYQVPFIFAGDRAGAEWFTYDLLKKFWVRKQNEVKIKHKEATNG